jgi:hypothetical protein
MVWNYDDFIGGYVGYSFTGFPIVSGNFRTIKLDDFDIVPKKEKLERDLKAKEEQKKNIERIKDMQMRHYDEQILDVDNQIKEIERQLSKKSK